MRNRWLTRRAVLSTLAIVIWAPGCLVAGWWQATVALSGNTLSYLYTVEWPAFAIFGIVVWWHLVHDDPDSVGARGLARLRALGAAGEGAAGEDAAFAGAAGEGAAGEGDRVAGQDAVVRGALAQSASADGAAERVVAPGVAAGMRELASDTRDSEGDEEVSAYNEYLRSLADRPKTWSRR